MPEEQLQEVSKDVIVTGTTKFGLGQIKKPTPAFAKWIFRVVLYFSSIGTFVINTDDEIQAKTAKRWTKYLAISTIAVHMGSKLFGVEIDENEFKVL